MPSKRTTRRKNSVTSYPGLREIPVGEDLLVSKRAARGREMEERKARKVDVLPIDHELLLRFQNSDKEACDMLHGQNKRRRSTLTREERLKSTMQNWDRQLDRLVDSYNIYINRLQIEIEPFPDPILSSESNYFDVTVWDLSERRNRKFLYDPDNSISANVALLRFGYIGAAPLSPSIAFHMRIFNAYEEKRTSSEKCPSLYAEAKVLSEKLGVPYRQIFGQQMLAAYEAYLKILRHVAERQSLYVYASRTNSTSDSAPINFDGFLDCSLYQANSQYDSDWTEVLGLESADTVIAIIIASATNPTLYEEEMLTENNSTTVVMNSIRSLKIIVYFPINLVMNSLVRSSYGYEACQGPVKL